MTRPELVLAEAKRYLGVSEVPKSSNRGLEIDYWLKEVGCPPGLPWCAAFVHQVGRQALGALWPCPRTASVAALAAWGATKAGVLQTEPHDGDIFLLWSRELNRFAHTGFVTPAGTIEGNTNNDGSRDGYGVFVRRRAWSPSDRFLRWEAAL